jgi:hypothetical protein
MVSSSFGAEASAAEPALAAQFLSTLADLPAARRRWQHKIGALLEE